MFTLLSGLISVALTITGLAVQVVVGGAVAGALLGVLLLSVKVISTIATGKSVHLCEERPVILIGTIFRDMDGYIAETADAVLSVVVPVARSCRDVVAWIADRMSSPVAGRLTVVRTPVLAT